MWKDYPYLPTYSPDFADNSTWSTYKEHKEPIFCPHCGAVVFDDKRDLMFLTITEDIRCPNCGEIVIFAGPIY